MNYRVVIAHEAEKVLDRLGWRILFTVDRDARVLFVATVDTRGQVYKHS
ncbi:MAG: hypothetical protein HYR60_30580 [Acidobacteria bacterium]|nr:hypothetical protein [Acidobacteriota bacterium]